MKKNKVIIKKYKVITPSDKFECKNYMVNQTCIMFMNCGDENYTKIIPTNVAISIYPIEKQIIT
jgi:hypothetical protein